MFNLNFLKLCWIHGTMVKKKFLQSDTKNILWFVRYQNILWFVRYQPEWMEPMTMEELKDGAQNIYPFVMWGIITFHLNVV